MRKASNINETLELTLELLKRIRKDEFMTTTELRDKLIETNPKFERTPRSIQRLLKDLSDPDFKAIDLERAGNEHSYRYRWKENAKGFSFPSLSLQESLLLTLAQQQLDRLLPAKLMKSMEGFFGQARNLLDVSSNHSGNKSTSAQLEQEWLKKVRVLSTSQPLLPPKVKDGVFEQVSNALYGNKYLEVTYVNAQGKVGNYKIMPLGLVQHGPCMYLACRYDGYNNNRIQALHRMLKVEASTLTFERPSDFDLRNLNDDLIFSEEPPKTILLRFRIDKGNGLHIVECPLSEDQQVVDLGSEYEITATVVDTDVLDRWLTGFGSGISLLIKSPI